MFPLLAALLGAGHGLAKESEPSLVSLNVKEAAPVAFSKGLLGAQEEVFVLPYLTADFWQKTRETGVSLLRYPCGTPSDWFLWDKPESGYWGSYAKKRNKTHPDAFVALCRENGIAPFITVNTAAYGAPVEKNRINPMRAESIQKGADYAAAWVRDFNVKKKYGVKYWEIGNEVWTWMRASEYPQFVRLYSKAMKAVDPSIRIAACGEEYDRRPFNASWLKFPDDSEWTARSDHRTSWFDWNQRLIQEAGDSFDHLSLHLYLTGDSPDPVQNTLEMFSTVSVARKLEQVITQLRAAHSPARIAITEWGVNFRWDPVYKNYFVKEMGYPEMKDLTYENSPAFTFGSLLVSADFIGRLASSGMVDIAVAHTLSNTLLRSRDNEEQKNLHPPAELPTGAALKFWHEFAGDTVLPVEIAGSPKIVCRGVRFPMLSAYATTSRAGGPLRLILINRSPDRTLHLALPATVAGKPVKTVAEHTISAESWGTSMWGSWRQPEDAPFKRGDRDVPAGEWGDYTLRPSRLTCLELNP